MKLYISGAIKGVDNHADLFRLAANRLKRHGFEVVKPLNVAPICLCGNPVLNAHYDCYMRGDIAAMMYCDGVALLDNWIDSKGANVERDLALKLHMPVKTVTRWVNEKTS